MRKQDEVYDDASESGAPGEAPSRSAICSFEQTALHLAQLAGAEITASLSRTLGIAYKTAGWPGQAPHDPVSEADRGIESIVRSRIAEAYPDHGILGEEIETPPDPARERVWVVDPIDGTLNFINGFPLFAASIGLLERGLPLVGAVWCATSHELRPGVYHARRGGPLCFEGHALRAGDPHPGVLRRLEAIPDLGGRRAPSRDARITGSAALECAFVAAGLLATARFRGVAIWDVAAGVALVRAAGGTALEHTAEGWRELSCFTPPQRSDAAGPPGLRDWRRSLILCSAASRKALRTAAPPA